jgi:hypothetical protein
VKEAREKLSMPLLTQVRIFSIAVIATNIFSGDTAKAHVVTEIDLDRQGRIYFTDTYHNCIWRLENNGTLTKFSMEYISTT